MNSEYQTPIPPNQTLMNGTEQKKSILRPNVRSMSTQAYFNMNKKIVTILCIKSFLIWTYANEPFLRNAILIEYILFMFSLNEIYVWFLLPTYPIFLTLP